MKNKILLLVFFPLIVFADEGMWLPHLLESLIYPKMKKNGLKIPADVIYSVNKTSMKDAVMLFGRGCTAEAISPHGLIITNHHCGYSSIVQVSSPEKNYLKNGFWAKNQQEEIPCPGLTVTFIRKIEDVTSRILNNIPQNYTSLQTDSLIDVRIRNLEKETSASSGYVCVVKPFYYGNEYYMFYTETFRDVRLVGTPEEVIGKFGGETDNWVWPRHNPDFCVFRIYANKENKPADYNPENVPYKPDWYFPVSIKPLKENEFTMVYGFPGYTQEYLSSHAVRFIIQVQNPLKINLRDKRLKVYEKFMKYNDTLKLKYADRYASVANYYKKMKGECMGIERTHAIDSIKKEEAYLKSVVQIDAQKLKYLEELLHRFEKIYTELEPIQKQWEFFNEGIYGIDIFRFIIQFKTLAEEAEKKKKNKSNRFDVIYKDLLNASSLKNFDVRVDKELFQEMMKEYEENIPAELRPAILDSLLKTYNKDYNKMADYYYSKSLLVSTDNILKVLEKIKENDLSMLVKDPFYQLVYQVSEFYKKNILVLIQTYEQKIQQLQKEYMKFQMDNLKDKTFYPDANGTLRIAFGKTEGMKPRDAVEYQWYSTVKGMMEKYKTGNPDYELTPKMEEMIKKNQFGKYAKSADEFRISFIASNHTTGGNSGSPVLNAYGHLIGINYDRCWESTMSDLYYSRLLCRNIALDMKFMLWYIDMYAGASYLLKEMKIIQ